MHRRDLLRTGAAAGLSHSAFSQSAGNRIESTRIQQLETFVVKVNARGNWVLVRLRTSDGLTGIGDASHGGPDATRIKQVNDIFGLLKGRSPFEVEAFRRDATRYLDENGTSAVIAFSALEQAMWDITGKRLGVPCFQLFGGPLTLRIRNYANINRSTEERSPAGFAARAREAVAAGFDAVKLAPWDDMPATGTPQAVERITNLGVARAEAVRSAIGPRVDLLLDAHSHFDLNRGLELARRVEPLNLFWLEEVVPAKPVDNLAEI